MLGNDVLQQIFKVQRNSPIYYCNLDSLYFYIIAQNKLAHKYTIKIGPVKRARWTLIYYRRMAMERLLADGEYDTHAIVNFANECGAQIIIPPRKHRKEPQSHDKFLYQYHHLVENTFLKFKQFRGLRLIIPKRSQHFGDASIWQPLFNGYDV